MRSEICNTKPTTRQFFCKADLRPTDTCKIERCSPVNGEENHRNISNLASCGLWLKQLLPTKLSRISRNPTPARLKLQIPKYPQSPQTLNPLTLDSQKVNPRAMKDKAIMQGPEKLELEQGCGAYYAANITKNPQNPIPILKAPKVISIPPRPTSPSPPPPPGTFSTLAPEGRPPETSILKDTQSPLVLGPCSAP